MLTTMLPLVVTLLGAVQATTDTTFAVRADARLELRDVTGSVRVEAWDEARVRLRADHGSRDRVRVDDRGGVVSLSVVRDRGRPVTVHYRLTVPRGMALTLAGGEVYLEVIGVRGALALESIEGDLVVRDVGAAVLATVDGDVTVLGAAGDVRVATTDGDLRLSGVRGSLVATTLDGDVLMDGMDARSLDVSTVDGEIRYEGAIHDGGRYRLTTHDGDVTLVVPSAINATVSVATYDGDFSSTFPVRLRPQHRHGHRFTFTLGNGSAQIELESFDGAIRLRSR